METDWKYIGLFLDKQSKYSLIKQVGKYIPDGWITYCHHMTLAFNKHDETSQQFYNMYKGHFGEPYTVVVREIGKSQDALAVKIDCHLKMANKLAHITIAVPVGGKPVDSNYITEWKPIEKPFAVSGTFQEFIENKR